MFTFDKADRRARNMSEMWTGWDWTPTRSCTGASASI